jgi:hypothetical protein
MGARHSSKTKHARASSRKPPDFNSTEKEQEARSFESTTEDATQLDEVVVASIAAIMRPSLLARVPSSANPMYSDSESSFFTRRDSDVVSLRWRLVLAMHADDANALVELLPLLLQSTVGHLVQDKSEPPDDSPASVMTTDEALNESINKKFQAKGTSLPSSFIALEFAARVGAKRCVRVLLKRWEDNMNPGLGLNTMTFIIAAQQGHAEVVDCMLASKHVDPTARNDKALFDAACKGHAKVVERLLKDDRVNASRACEGAFRSGHIEVAKVVLENDRVDMVAEGKRALVAASEQQAAHVVKLLLQDKRLECCAKEAALLLRTACCLGDTKWVKELLSDNDVKPAEVERLFEGPAKHGHAEVVKMLLQDGRADPKDALELAVCFGHQDVVKLLMDDTRMHIDCTSLALQVERAIMDGNASVGFVKYIMTTPFMPSIARALGLACKHGRLDLVQLFFAEANESIPIDWDFRNEVIWAACDSGYDEIVNVLLQDPKRTVGANPDFCFSIACRYDILS